MFRPFLTEHPLAASWIIYGRIRKGGAFFAAINNRLDRWIGQSWLSPSAVRWPCRPRAGQISSARPGWLDQGSPRYAPLAKVGANGDGGSQSEKFRFALHVSFARSTH